MIREDPKMASDGGPQAAGATSAPREELPPGVHLPSPSLWPAALGLGVALLLFGIVTHWVFSLLGAALSVVAIARWIAEVRVESHSAADNEGHG
jgi:hypothetical protein